MLTVMVAILAAACTTLAGTVVFWTLQAPRAGRQLRGLATAIIEALESDGGATDPARMAQLETDLSAVRREVAAINEDVTRRLQRVSQERRRIEAAMSDDDDDDTPAAAPDLFGNGHHSRASRGGRPRLRRR